jgi:hypothetical protein
VGKIINRKVGVGFDCDRLTPTEGRWISIGVQSIASFLFASDTIEKGCSLIE